MGEKQKVTIQVVADHPTTRDSVAKALEAAGFPVVQTQRGSWNPNALPAGVSAVVLEGSEAGIRQAREDDIARRIQRELLMGKPPRHFPGVTIAAGTVSSERVDGDFYDFFRFGNDCLDVMIGDVMGKGVSSALMGAALKTLFLRVIHELEHAEIHPVSPPDPVHIVSRAQAVVVDRLRESGEFATICYGRFDFGRRLYRYVDCSHPETIHYQKDSGTVHFLGGVNMPMGFPEMKPFVERTVPFSEGDVFFLYSDGLTKARNSEGEAFGENRLLESLRSHIRREPDAMIRHVWDDVIRFTGSDWITNDLTSVAVRIGSLPATASVRESELEIPCDIQQTSHVRRFIRDFAESGAACPAYAGRLEMLILAATEVVTNIIRHACVHRPEARIRISARKTSDYLEISFFDRGDVFDPGAVPPPRFDGSREGGFGLYIISHAVDEYTYTHDAEGNNCTRLLISTR